MKPTFSFLIVFLSVIVLFSCKRNSKNTSDLMKSTLNEVPFNKESHLQSKDFDTIIDGKPVKLYWLEKDSIKVAFTNYGGRLIGLWVPNKNGEMTDVVVGMNSIESYIKSTEPYFGATIGRVGNRIAKGKFNLNGVEYTIPQNNNGNALHGGVKGFQYVVWDAEMPNNQTLILKYSSPHMEEGFPGNLEVKVTYSLIDGTGVNMEYEATTDMATPVNLTNHAFFNLNGEGSGTILNHKVLLEANKFTVVDSFLIPTGDLKDVEGTPFDFREFHTIGERITTENEQLKNGLGYDHNFVLDQQKDTKMKHAAMVIGDKSGIVMEVYTQEPGVQFYSGNFMQGKNTLKSGAQDDFRTAFALETQHFPDAPNQNQFPSIILKPGENYHTVSKYMFSVAD